MKIHLFDKDQNTEQFPAQQTVFQLGDTGDCMFAVAAGADRAPAVLGAMRGGLFKSLLADEALAAALLAN
jgi:DNA-binding transcriptional regulator LsrR (DeoR family)